jgi:ribonuclease P protein component
MEPDREQADLPAEQPSPGQDPRLPPADADPRGPRDPAGSPAQGSRRALGLSQSTSVLPAAHRLRSSADFTAVTRSGRRARSGAVVVYLLAASTGRTELQAASRIGLVVSKAVGGSVIRHQVSRRLRAQLGARLDRIPAGARVVVRALPESAGLRSAALGQDLNRALAKLTSDHNGRRAVEPRDGRSGSSR